MAFRWTYLSVFILSVLVSGCVGRRGHGHRYRHHEENDSHENDWEENDSHENDWEENDSEEDDSIDESWAWGAAAGIGVIIGIIVGVCGLFSLVGWVSCTLYSKCRKDKVGVSSLIKKGSHSSAPPAWSADLVFKPELAAGFGSVSDGFLRIGPAQLVRNRAGTSITDGARWAVGMTKGKHIFEITWPWGHRGYHAGVGVGMEDAPITTKGRVPLVGSNPKTWGLDIVKRRTIHNNSSGVTCPTDGSYVPDRFLMYVNMDEGTLGYGNDVTYWGEVITDLPRQGTQPLYVMVGASQWQSEIYVTYKGSAPDGTDTKTGGRPPHHLPPLFPMAAQAPPTYMEFDQNKPIMVMPPGPSEEVMYEPPPPYSRPPTGYTEEKA